MKYCFCIQPFDAGVYDKRFDDIFQPAIEKAGLKAYRVDRDPSSEIPIEDIENRIIGAELCFAEITTNNPNVWYELGFSIAVPKSVVLVSSEERTSNYPFDIRHRSVIKYKTESQSDFDQLKDKITKRILALLKKHEQLSSVSKRSPIADTEGLTQSEMVALVTVMQNRFADEEAVSTSTIQRDMHSAGLNNLAVSLALSSLQTKGFITSKKDSDWNGNEFFVFLINDIGKEWLIRNQAKLVLTIDPEKQPTPDKEDDLPF